MRKQKYSIWLLLPVLLLVFLLSACSQTTTGSSNLSPQDILQKSVDSMKQLKSDHMDLSANIEVKSTPKQGDAQNTSSTISANVTGQSDQQYPSPQQVTLNANALGQANTVSTIITSDKVYYQAQKDKWYVVDRNAFENAGNNPYSAVTLDPNSLLAALQQVSLKDHGDEKVGNDTLRHISADIKKEALKALLQNNPQLKSALGIKDQDIDTALNNLKTFKSTVDVWIDSSKYYVHKLNFKLNTSGDVQTPQTGSSTLDLNLDSTVNLSKFNQPVTITIPTDATPVDPSQLTGTQTPQQ